MFRLLPKPPRIIRLGDADEWRCSVPFFGRRGRTALQPTKIAEIVSDDKHDKTASESISPTSVNRHAVARSGAIVAADAA